MWNVKIMLLHPLFQLIKSCPGKLPAIISVADWIKKTFHFERLRVPIEVDLPYFHNFFTPIIPFRCNSSGKIDPNSLLLEHNQDVCSLIRACRMSMRRTFCLYIGFAHLHDYYLVDDLILHYLCVNAHEWMLRDIFKERLLIGPIG